METRIARSDSKLFEGIRKGALSGAYFFHGAEEFTKERAIRLIKEKLAPAVADMNWQVLTNPAARDVMDACETLPFFDERRIVIVRELSAEAGGDLAEYTGRVPDTALLIIYQRGEARRDGALYKLLEKQGRAVDFAPYDEDMALSFLRKRAEFHGFLLERSGARRLIAFLGTDLAQLENGLLKAGSYVEPGSPVTAAAVDGCITPNVEYKVFSLLDLLVSGKRQAGLAMLAAMLQSGESAMGLSAFLEGRVKQMLTGKELLAAGLSEAAAVKRLGGSPYAAKMTLKNARRCSLDQLRRAVVAFGKVDLAQKQGRMQDADALLLAVLETF